MNYQRFAVSPSMVLQERRKARKTMRNAGLVGIFVGAVLDVFTWFPLLVIARLGLLRARSNWSRGGPPGPGSAGAGVGARLPVMPPQLSAGAAKELPPDGGATAP